MLTTLKRIALTLKPTNQSRVLWISLFVLMVGLILTFILVYLGVYKPSTKWIISISLVLLSITLCLALIYVSINFKFNLKLIFFIPVAILYIILLAVCVDSLISIIEWGYIKCDLCP